MVIQFLTSIKWVGSVPWDSSHCRGIPNTLSALAWVTVGELLGLSLDSFLISQIVHSLRLKLCHQLLTDILGLLSLQVSNHLVFYHLLPLQNPIVEKSPHFNYLLSSGVVCGRRRISSFHCLRWLVNKSFDSKVLHMSLPHEYQSFLTYCQLSESKTIYNNPLWLFLVYLCDGI